MASSTTTTAPKGRAKAKRTSRSRRPQRNGEQVRIMAYGMVQVGAVGASLAHVYDKHHISVTRCGLELGARGPEVRDASFADYSEAECQSCCEMFGVARLWQIYPPMNLGEHLWDDRGRRR